MVTKEESDNKDLSPQQLEAQINELMAKASYQMNIVAVSKSGVHLPVSDVIADGFGVTAILIKVDNGNDDTAN